jgi:hypothetical protein
MTEHVYKAYELLEDHLAEKLSSNDVALDELDKILHGMKSAKTIIAMCEAEEGHSRDAGYRKDYNRDFEKDYSRDYSRENNYSRDGMNYSRDNYGYSKDRATISEMRTRR